MGTHANGLNSAPEVNHPLMETTQRAIGPGVIGVLALVLRDRFFWRGDTVDCALRFLNEPDLFQQQIHAAAEKFKFGVA
jgi:hypothetical protein